jgi:hypothetical protein
MGDQIVQTLIAPTGASVFDSKDGLSLNQSLFNGQGQLTDLVMLSVGMNIAPGAPPQ